MFEWITRRVRRFRRHRQAALQMELLGHNFFLYFDADYEGLKLLYRRRDGNYGLIEPELA